MAQSAGYEARLRVLGLLPGCYAKLELGGARARQHHAPHGLRGSMNRSAGVPHDLKLVMPAGSAQPLNPQWTVPGLWVSGCACRPPSQQLPSPTTRRRSRARWRRRPPLGIRLNPIGAPIPFSCAALTAHRRPIPLRTAVRPIGFGGPFCDRHPIGRGLPESTACNTRAGTDRPPDSS